MEWIEQIIIVTGLSINAFLDIKKREVSAAVVMLMALSGWVFHLLSCRFSITDLLMGLLPGIIALIISWVGREAIGYGDVWILLGMGLVLGGKEMMKISMTALLGAGCCALVLLLIFKKGRKYELPFVPFLLLADLVSIGGKLL